MPRPLTKVEASQPLPARPAIRIHDLRKTFGQLIGNIGVFGKQGVAVVRLAGGHRVHHFFHRRH